MPTIAITMKITAASINKKLEVDGRCTDCMLRNFDRLMVQFPISQDARQDFFQTFNHTMAHGANKLIPEIHRILSQKYTQLVGIEDLYLDEKNRSNELALDLYREFKPQVLASSNPFNMALRLSIAGNIMDYSQGAEFDIQETIEKVLHSAFAIDQSIELEKKIKQAKKILYLGDNAGEIVFDKLFIEMIMHPNLTYVVRGGAALNDVLLSDAQQVGIDLVADVISNGYNASSTILDKCSDEFLKIYHEADLIISKGQGNLEGLIDANDPRIFFLLMVKCDVMAERIGVDKGSFVVMNPLEDLKN
jgi:uncharacterized protein with ATP-grasp and redox domains